MRARQLPISSVAERFYRSDGWEPDGALRTADAWSFTVDEIRYGRSL